LNTELVHICKYIDFPVKVLLKYSLNKTWQNSKSVESNNSQSNKCAHILDRINVFNKHIGIIGIGLHVIHSNSPKVYYTNIMRLGRRLLTKTWKFVSRILHFHVKTVKLLGIEIDYQLNFDIHISSICRKASQQLNILKCLGPYLDRLSKLTILHSFILSNFNFCPLAWHFCTDEN
jgi:hypothetical protein